MSRLDTIRPGTAVKVLHNAGSAGTCLSGTTVVLAVSEDRRRVTVPLPRGCVTPDDHGTYTLSLHDDYVLVADEPSWPLGTRVAVRVQSGPELADQTVYGEVTAHNEAHPDGKPSAFFRQVTLDNGQTMWAAKSSLTPLAG